MISFFSEARDTQGYLVSLICLNFFLNQDFFQSGFIYHSVSLKGTCFDLTSFFADF